MNLILRIALAHLVSRKRQTLVSILGVAMGVGFFIGIASMMQGFQRDFVARVIDVSPHVTIKDEFRNPPIQPVFRVFDGAVALRGLRPREEVRGIQNAQAILAEIRRMPGVVAAPTLRGQVFYRYGGQEVSSTMVGIEPDAERRVTNIEQDLVAGSLNSLLSAANGVILGEGLAQKLGARLGDSLTAVSPAGVILRVKVVGIVRTGIVAIDNFESYALLKKVQVLQKRPQVINQIRLRLADIEQARAVATAVEDRFGYRTESWEEANQNVLGIFVIQNGIMYSTVGAILIVAEFGIFNIISTVIYEKTRDIAILKSIGLTETDIRRIFLIEGFVLGLIGAFIGWVIGFGLVELLGSIEFKIEGFVKSEGFILYRSPRHYLVSGAFAVIAATLAAWIPARKAARVNPVDIVRGAA